MKKLMILLMAVCFTATSFSQGIDVGIKAGANFANLSDVDDVSTRTGFLAGAFVTLKFSDKIAIQGDVLYSQQGAAGEKGMDDIKLDYIIFPVVFKYYLVNRLNIQAGPQFGTVVNDNLNNTRFESFDVSGVVGIGVDLPLNLRVTGRYSFGLSDIAFVDVYDGVSFETDAKNNVFSLSVGFSFL